MAPLVIASMLTRGVAQEFVELAGKSIVPNLEFLRGLAHIVDVVWRVGEDHVGQAAGQDQLDRLHAGGIAAQQPVFSQEPEVAGDGDDLLLLVRNRIVVGQPLVRLFRRQELLDLFVGKAQDIEIEVLFLQRGQLDAQHGFIPTGVQRQAVVREHQCAALGRRQMVENDHRNVGHPQFARRRQARVARDDNTVAADEDRIDESKFGDRRCYLRHLFVAVRPRVSGVRNESVDGPAFNNEVAQNAPQHPGSLPVGGFVLRDPHIACSWLRLPECWR